MLDVYLVCLMGCWIDVGCLSRILDWVSDAFYRMLDAFLGFWIGCWMLFNGVGCVFRVSDRVLDNLKGVGWGVGCFLGY